MLRSLTLIGIVLSIVTGMSLGILAHLKWQGRDNSLTTRTVADVVKEVSTHYVNDIDEQQLLEYALDGMLRGLDEHSDYLNNQSLQNLQDATAGRFGGIGIELGLVDGYFTVIAPIDDTPAQRAGMLAGDRIVGVDGDSVKGMKLSALIDRLRGVPGSAVSLDVRRDASDSSDASRHTFELLRQNIRIASVTGRELAPGYGYLRIAHFQVRTGEEVAAQIDKLQSEHGPLKGLVLDLRNNPGGTLQSSVEVADHFLHSGLIVSTAGRLPSAAGKYRATQGDLLGGAPVVVLINSGSASASEIVAASLKDHGRAHLMGVTSYGKGSVQSVLPLSSGQAIKLTTAYYYTPLGETIHERGVTPDLNFEGSPEELVDEALDYLRTQQAELVRAES